MLTQDQIDVLAIALVDNDLATEFATLADSAASATDELKRNLEIALCDKDSFDEIVLILEGGPASLTDGAKDALAIAICDKDVSDAVIVELEA